MKRSKVLRRLTTVLAGSIHTRGFVLWIAALLTGILCVSQHVYSTKLAADIEHLRTSREELEAQIGFLAMERAQLMGRERVEQYATERLGMRYPKADEVVRIGPGTGGLKRPWEDGLVSGGTNALVNG
jgi:cell division protein FtsL